MESEIRCMCSALSTSYGRKKVLRDCSLTVRTGEIVGLVGENGSGKSTLVRSLLGFSTPSAGTVRIASPVGYCPQDNLLNRKITLQEHLTFMSAIYGAHHGVDSTFADELIGKLRLRPLLQTLIGNLSSGTFQKVKLLTSIVHRPAVIFLDEPCDGFDWAMYLVFWEIMEAVNAGGSAVLMVSHLLHDRERFNRIYELREGSCEQVQ